MSVRVVFFNMGILPDEDLTVETLHFNKSFGAVNSVCRHHIHLFHNHE